MRAVTEKPLLFLDIDDTSREFNDPLRAWTNRHYDTRITSIKDILSFNLDRVWQCGKEEMYARLERFYESEEFMNARFFPGAIEALEQLSAMYRVVVATARRSSLKKTTLEQLSPIEHLIEDVYFKEDFPDGIKARLARKMGAVIGIDDAQHNVRQYLASGVGVVQYNFNNTFGWNELSRAPPGALTSTSWEENYKHCTELLRRSA